MQTRLKLEDGLFFILTTRSTFPHSTGVWHNIQWWPFVSSSLTISASPTVFWKQKGSYYCMVFINYQGKTYEEYARQYGVFWAFGMSYINNNNFHYLWFSAQHSYSHETEGAEWVLAFMPSIAELNSLTKYLYLAFSCSFCCLCEVITFFTFFYWWINAL